MVNLHWLREALRGDGIWADAIADRDKENFNPDRYEPIIRQINAGQPMHTPWLFFNRGRIQIMDGRHRLYAFSDLGYTHVTVVVSPKDAAAIGTIADPDFTGDNFSWNKRPDTTE